MCSQTEILIGSMGNGYPRSRRCIRGPSGWSELLMGLGACLSSKGQLSKLPIPDVQNGDIFLRVVDWMK